MNLYYVACFLGLFAWLVFTSEVSALTIAMGVIISFFAFWLFHTIYPTDKTKARVNPVALVIFIPWYTMQVILSGLRLALMVCLKKPDIDELTINYEMAFRDKLHITVFANLITLTPGTLTINFIPEKNILTVHCLKYSRFFKNIDPLKDIKDLEKKLKGVFMC